MKSRFWLSAFAACGISFAAFAAPANVKAASEAAIKEVDLGGEMLHWNDLTFLTPLINEQLPMAVKVFSQDSEYSATIDQSVKSILKLINIQAFKGLAASSIESAPGVYTYKTFLLADMQQPSILLDTTAKNVPLNWLALPADTRLAFKGHVNLARVWQMIYAEMKNNPDPVIREAAGEIVAEAAKTGFDINKLAAALDGEMELLLTGTNIQDVAIKVVIPDKNGAISELLKQALPPRQGTNTAIIPTPIGINIQVIYEAGKITAVSNPRLLQRPSQTLATLPHFRQYATLVPDTGTGYFVLDIPQDVLNMLRALCNETPELVKLFDIFIKPCSLVMVGQTTPNGGKSVTASNISFAQLQVVAPGIASFATQAAMLLPALQKARDRGRQANCTNNMKQFSTACIMYADDKNGVFPPDIDTLIKNKYISDEVCEDIILLLPGVNINKLNNPSSTPLAICDRASHSEANVCVVFADGHVESLPVDESADESDVVSSLAETYNPAPELVKLMLAQVAEEGEDEDEE
ncbi:MAG: DUF1559 domain-containing protein [Lentisphaerae bacterium]|nr:DUF1559 domain-containing protein [Lentisphaerota bacterium]